MIISLKQFKYNFLFVLIFLAACSCKIGIEPDDPDNNESNIWSGNERGYKENSIIDQVLIYQGGVQRPDWTPDQMRPYVIHTSQTGNKQWLFDGFLFLEFQDGQGHNFAEGYQGNENATKKEWEWLINRHFESGKAISALNSCVEEGKGELGTPSFKHKVVIGVCEPILNQKNWGELNGKKLDFSNSDDRISACKWYIDELIKRFNAGQYANLELAGFYWISEHMSKSNGITTEIGRYIRNKGMMFYWIPYYHSNGFSQWKEYGFDMAYLQPNYFFNETIPYERLDNACKLAFTHNMGLEVEFDGNALASSSKPLRYRLENYIEVFQKSDVFKNASVAYYEGGGALLAMSKSPNKADRNMLDTLAMIIGERRHRMIDNALCSIDFKKTTSLDKSIWTISGSEQAITFAPSGMQLSSNGAITKLSTRNSVGMKYGRIEVRAKVVSKAEDAIIRLHMLPVEEKLGLFPLSGDMFLMNYFGSSPNSVRVGANTAQMNENKGNIKESVIYLNNLKNNFHTYVCEWDEKKISFYIDGMCVNIQEDLFDKKYSSYPEFWPFNEQFYFEISIMSNSKEPALIIESLKIRKQ